MGNEELAATCVQHEQLLAFSELELQLQELEVQEMEQKELELLTPSAAPVQSACLAHVIKWAGGG